MAPPVLPRRMHQHGPTGRGMHPSRRRGGPPHLQPGRMHQRRQEGGSVHPTRSEGENEAMRCGGMHQLRYRRGCVHPTRRHGRDVQRRGVRQAGDQWGAVRGARGDEVESQAVPSGRLRELRRQRGSVPPARGQASPVQRGGMREERQDQGTVLRARGEGRLAVRGRPRQCQGRLRQVSEEDPWREGIPVQRGGMHEGGTAGVDDLHPTWAKVRESGLRRKGHPDLEGILQEARAG
mmetsp:Transcript_19223/g.41081  ORF Transcript_19223/g.41081 Transcript_19223/m.41081 type:complete len:236 (+) Transcript_19223:46-753(+)